MMNRRDLLLQEMNITQWQLTKPQVLKGDAQIRLDQAIKFVVICEEDQQQSQFFQDVLHTLQIQPNEYRWLNFEQAMRLSIEHQPQFWLIQPEQQAASFVKKFANHTAWQHTDWQLLQSPESKRKLWQMIEPHRPQFEELV